MMKRYVWAGIVFLAMAMGTSVGMSASAADTASAADKTATAPQVELDTSMGKIKLELFPQAAPKTVENFLGYVKSGFYDGTLFHRVIDKFMIQGGGYDEKLQEKPTKPPIPNEGPENQKAGVKNTIGTIAMARRPDPNSASAQFFINVANNTPLDYTASTPQGYGYTVFGKVIEGMDVVNKIAKVETGMQGGQGNLPKTPVVIHKAVVVKAGNKGAAAK
ncbi:MAG: peptidylprolyl isomerase [Burkholderiales bacterium]|jgi:cyclophilin family peptidyl-prolyl cis-trans isomerase|nr:peptidylprolyl isomerase [Burkholderiales bacterium]